MAAKQSSLVNQSASLPGNQSEGTGREAGAGFRHSPSPEFTICHVKLQTCQSQDFLQFYFQGQMLRRGGDPTAGERCPNSCHTSHKDLRGGRAHHCLPFFFRQLHPLTCPQPGLRLALKPFKDVNLVDVSADRVTTRPG